MQVLILKINNINKYMQYNKSFLRLAMQLPQIHIFTFQPNKRERGIVTTELGREINYLGEKTFFFFFVTRQGPTLALA